METSGDIALCLVVALVAWLYSSVGHAGASGYIAVMTLAGFAPERIKPLALILNILVASIASVQFYRAGHFSWKLFWPIALLAAPMAFVGGYLSLPLAWFKVLLGLVLAGSAVWLLNPMQNQEQVHEPARHKAILAGAGLGLLSGLTGTG
ncbi:MAG: TSUP family transporter, partial [Pirellula sp.]